MRSLKRLIEIVHSIIDVSEWEENCIDWQEVANACLEDIPPMSVDEFCIAVEAMTMMRYIFLSHNGWRLK